jgi:hypothetical protein
MRWFLASWMQSALAGCHGAGRYGKSREEIVFLQGRDMGRRGESGEMVAV